MINVFSSTRVCKTIKRIKMSILRLHLLSRFHRAIIIKFRMFRLLFRKGVMNEILSGLIVYTKILERKFCYRPSISAWNTWRSFFITVKYNYIVGLIRFKTNIFRNKNNIKGIFYLILFSSSFLFQINLPNFLHDFF